MKTTRLPGLFTWSVFQDDRGIDFNGFFLVREGGNLLVDPMPGSDHHRKFVAERGGAASVLVTNADHWRAAGDWQASTGAKILAPATERDRLGERAAQVDHWYTRRDDLPDGLPDEVDLAWIHGGKSPQEAVLYFKDLRALLFGDVVRSHASGTLCLLPEAKLADPARVHADVLALRDVHLEAILLGDGDSLFVGARGVWLEFLRELGRTAKA